MWEHLRAWFLGRPVEAERAGDPARRDAAVCGPKPLAEAVGDAISAVGELVLALRATKKHTKKPRKSGKKRSPAASRSRAAKSSPAPTSSSSRSRATPARGVVVVEARVEPRAATRARKPARRSARMTLDAPIVVAPAGTPAPKTGES